MIPEAGRKQTEHGVLPEGEGWYVLNAREAEWYAKEGLGASVDFEGDVRFAQYGVNIQVLDSGEPNSMYHGEEDQEDFLVLYGECILIVEGEERPAQGLGLRPLSPPHPPRLRRRRRRARARSS